MTDIYSTSDDFYWLAGRDVYLPVETSDGELVAYLAVRHYGFDLDGVPDKGKNRREALRASLGNLRRKAEAIFAESGGVMRPERSEDPGDSETASPRGAVPEFPVRGKRD